MPAGRPNEGRVRLTVHVRADTATAINSLLNKNDRSSNTQGKVIDLLFVNGTQVKKDQTKGR